MLGSTKCMMLCYAALPSAGTWLKIGSDVGWSAKGNGHGTLRVSQKLCASEVKFVHKSGYVACAGQCSMGANVTRYMYSHAYAHVHMDT